MIAPCPTRAEAADAVLGRLAQIVGVKHVVTDTLELAPHLVEPRELFKGRARAMVRPATTAEVSRVMALCNEIGLPVVPQGGNTGLVGGQTPHDTGDEIIL
ncbi:MAG: FAD-binding oxidoreductase, partial [Methylobacteriaceae bacterium]|nr:FAD-binding oxidoreductase [Methylobacteriaceae bacterium]